MTPNSSKVKIAFVLAVLVVVSGALYAQGYFEQWRKIDPLMYGDSHLKLAFGPEHAVLLSNTPNKRLTGHYALSGETVPGTGLVVLGYDEASLIAKENHINVSDIDQGFLLNNFSGSGKDYHVAGVLRKMNASADKISFVSENDYKDIPGKTVELKRTADMMPKLFYYIEDSNKRIRSLALSNGSMEDYKKDGKYYPLILGRSEANMMIKEKLISKTGDKIENLFGKPVYLEGIFNATGTGLDVLHYLPEE